jgi:hypothetical protein
MTTHFHLLVRSPAGELSNALQSTQNEYVRRFNRRRRRDGSLVRGRFCSRLVASLRYRRTLVRYIDDNPVAAGLVPAAGLFPHGSARHYLRPSGPPWLTREWVEGVLRDASGTAEATASTYVRVFGGTLAPGLRHLIERRLQAGPCAEDPLDELHQAAAPAVQAWMRRKAELADGTQPGIPLVDPQVAQEVLSDEEGIRGSWRVRTGRRSTDGWLLAKVGLLRDLCATTYEEAANRCARTTQNAWTLHQQHRRLVLADEDYALRTAELATLVLAACWGAPAGGDR